MDFPFKKHFMKDEEIHEMMKNLSNFSPTESNINLKVPLQVSSNPKNGILSFILPENEYTHLNNISDYFNEEARMTASKNGKQNPLEFYHNHKKDIFKKSLEKFGNTNCYSLRETLYETYPYEAEAFKPSHVVTLAKLFKSKSILDFSAGWGDRLIGAISLTHTDYTGIDPNPNVHIGYKKICDFFNFSKATLIQDCFEDVNLGDKMFDLIITSPPYFDLEIYEKENKKQSTNKFKTLEKWFYGFLMTCLKKASEHLLLGGYIAINIQDDAKHNFVNRMIEEFTQHYNIEFDKIILFGKHNSKINDLGRPFFIFQKTNKFELNPPLYITPFWARKNIFVVRDDVLPGGTKQRAVIEFLKDKIQQGFNEFVYSGPFTGAAQIALAIGCQQLGVKATIFVSKIRPQSTQTQCAVKFGAVIIDNSERMTIKDLEEISTKYVNDDVSKRFKIPFGFDDKIFKKTMIENLKIAVSKAVISTSHLGERKFKKDVKFNFLKKRTMFLVGGSATLLNILYEVFPNYKFVVIQVGKTIWPDQIDNKNTTIYVASEKFNENAKFPPPYPSIQNYDAKVWSYVMKYGQEGDIVWNVR